jgi:hypothetical protein
MANDFYQATGSPSTRSSGSSSTMRAEFAAIEDAFDKLPTMTGNADEVVVVDAGGNALTTKAFSAENMANTPAGGISATTVQAAIDELDTDKAPKANPSFTGTISTNGVMELTANATGDRASYIDLHADDTNTDRSARVIRNSGVNGTFDLVQEGTGSIRLTTAGNARLAIDNAGVITTPFQPACVVSRNAGPETLSASTSYGIANAFHRNRGGFYAGSAIGGGGAVLHVPATGYYLVCFNVFYGAAATGDISLYVNNTSGIGLVKAGGASTTSSSSYQVIIPLTAGDYLSLRVGATDVSINSSYPLTQLTVIFIG